MISRAVYRKRTGRRWITTLAAAALMTGTVVFAGTAQAVHDEGVFQLDDNAVTVNPPAGEDWDLVFNGTDTADSTSFVTDVTFGGALFGQGDTIFTGGDAKDIWDLPATDAHHWLWKQTNVTSVQDKDDIEHAFAAQYLEDKSGPTNGPGCGTIPENDPRSAECVLLYFGADRFSNSGSSMLGFWFFQKRIGLNPLPNPLPTGGTSTFNGSHTARNVANGTRGDILILADFLLGGGAPTVRVFEWVGIGGGGSDGPLDLIGGTDITPSDCNGAPPPKANATPVPPVGANDNLCATVNGVTVPSPWTFTPKPNTGTANNFSSGMLLEGGINMTALGLGNECFNSFMAETRSSHAVTATLSDFALGDFGSCGASLATQTSDTLLEVGDPAPTDDAIVTVTGTAGNPPAPTGEVEFFLCGPSTTAITSCDTTTGSPFDTVDLSTAVANGNTYTVTSSAPTISSAGYYCFGASWAGDVPPADNYTEGPYTDDGTNECFQVTPKQPTISTQVNDAGPVSPGTELYDTATLGNTATPSNGVNGTITFQAFGPAADATTCTAPAIYTSVITVSGNGSYDSNDGDANGDGVPGEADDVFAPLQPGNYNWIATYTPGSGDVNNLGVAGSCGDANEGSVVRQIPTQIMTKQSWYPNDTATITSSLAGDNLGAGGTVDFDLYVGATCSGSSVYHEQVTLTGGAHSEEVGTSNTTYAIATGYADAADSTTGVYSWKVVYVPAAGDTAHTGIQSACSAEHFDITYTNDAGPGTDLP